MKSHKFSKRAAYIATTAIAMLVVAGIAFAYFTSTGTGTGSATVGTAANTITVTGSTVDLLYPGGPGVEVTFTASNPEDFNQKLTTIHLDGVEASDPSCDVTAFTMGDVTVGADGNLDPNTTDAALSETGTLSMADDGTDQDACKNADLTLAFTTS